MHPLLVPAILALAALRTSTTKPSAAARAIPAPPQPSRSPQARAMPAAQAAPLKNRTRVNVGPAHINPPLEVSHEPEHPNVIPAPPQAQAAVDAAMSQVVRELQSERPQPPPSPTPQPTAAEPDSKRTAAAKGLLAFLIRTGRFGTLAHDPGKPDRPKEIKAAQTVLGVVPDGIVGPKTREAAEAAGVALPPRPKK